MRNLLVIVFLLAAFNAQAQGRNEVADAMDKVIEAQNAIEDARDALYDAQQNLTTATNHLQDVLDRRGNQGRTWHCTLTINGRQFQGSGPTKPDALIRPYNACTRAYPVRMCQRQRELAGCYQSRR